MKNIHLQKTDKPSRLKQNKITKKISLVNKGIDLTSYTPINIYITSDVEIKEGDWILDIELNRIEQCLYSGTFRNWKKIILTTDQDLISDGVQAIPDEFLEWFVHNPSCEWVEINQEFNPKNMVYGINTNPYKIIIPKEEPKQETFEEAAKNFVNKYYSEESYKRDIEEAIKFGVKWQQEQDKKLYSEDDMKQAFENGSWVTSWSDMGIEMKYDDFETWFKTYKKK
jgi:hypothetical protein